MPELLYASEGKLKRWPLKGSISGRVTAEVNAKVAKIALAPANSRVQSTEQLYSKIHRVCREIDMTPGFTRWLKDGAVGRGTWFTFDSRLRWGRIGRGVARGLKEPIHNMVFFGGPTPSDNPVLDLLMGGWSGHLVGEESAHDPSGRIGSRLDDFFQIWSDVSVDDQNGVFRIPERLLRIRREKSRGDTVTLEEVFRWAYGTFDHALQYHPEVSLRGYAQVLATLPPGGYDLPMVVGTPLFVEMNYG